MANRKQKVLILTYTDHVPPASTRGMDLSNVDWRLEYDVLHTLHAMGEDVKILGVDSDLGKIRDTVEAFQPDIAFNLLDEFDGKAIFDQNVVSYLELLHLPYTGSNPRGLMLTRDKALSKKILHYHRIPVPEFHVFPKKKAFKVPRKIKYPLFVKSLIEQASMGISQSSIVTNEQKLRERVQFIHDSVGTDAIAEAYIEGKELYVGVMGNQRLEVFPTWEMLFFRTPEQTPHIATYRVKFDPAYRKKYGITTGRARKLTELQEKHIQHICRRTYKALNMSGYGRIDLRMSQSGEIYVLEANPNPQLSANEDFAQAALKAGYSYPSLIAKILKLGLSWKPSDAIAA